MTDALRLTAAADRSLAWCEGDSVRYIVATIEGARDDGDRRNPAPRVNLALVIDASGSMTGEKLEHAKRAAQGVAGRLRDGDRLSIVSFADEVVVHANAIALSAAKRGKIDRAISELTTRGCTNLSDGWFAGAECVARAMREGELNRVVILSDGAANGGIVDPEQLAVHARELAGRGVTTSCVGIGDGYETEVLQAIAQSGGGRLHDAETGSEIVEALMGELNEIDDLCAQNVSVTLHVPATAKAAFVGSAPTQVGAGMLSVAAGGLLAGRPRACVFRVTLPKGAVDGALIFGLTVRGVTISGEALESGPVEMAFTFVESARNKRQPRDGAASMAVAAAWNAEIVKTAARMNRAGERRQARHYVERELQYFERYCAGLPEAQAFLKEIVILKQNVDRQWDERTRKEMELRAYCRLENRVDYRPERSSWSERLNDGR